jgi:drug/metabolite transporter (DMT)-like permease
MKPALATTSPSRPARGIALMLLAVVGWVAMDTIGKYLVSHGVPVWQATWARYAFHLAVMLPVLVRGTVGMRTVRPGLQILRSLLLLAVTFLVYTALGHLPLATVNAIGFLAPLLITALSVPLLGEKVGIRRWLAVTVGFVGVVIVVRPNPGMETILLLPLLVALINALYQITTRVLARSGDRATTTLFWTAIGGLVVTTAIVPFVWVWPDPLGWTLMIALGALGCVSHWLMIESYSSAPAAVLAPFVYTQLIWVIPVGYVTFGDFPDTWTLVGASLIVASGLYAFYRETVRAQAEARERTRAAAST